MDLFDLQTHQQGAEMNYRQRKTHLVVWLMLLLVIPVAFYTADRYKPTYQQLEPQPMEFDGPNRVDVRELGYRSESVFAIVRARVRGTSDLYLVQEEPINVPGVAVFISWDDELTEMKYLGPLGSKHMEHYEIPELQNPFFRKVVLYSIVEDRVVRVIRPLF